MPRRVEVKEGQSFQDGTGLTVRVGEIDANDRVHFSVIEDREAAGPGEMSYVAFRRVRIYGEEFELLSDPFPERDRIAIRAKAKGDSGVRILRLPATIAQGGRGRTV